MSYQVLARKWRPRTFHELVGQEHVSRALVNALDQGRLHHAYLFTGTRGVGKTTLARILSKCLNCEQGVTSRPCGTCQTCVDIDNGRFVDLIEVDAASRTKVEDTRELLDNVQYAPTQGRYKVYLIDEVHMLSTHSFNALLKTLEEPPPHVKFLLATTDPQKLPVTVLSRCLQFTLKNMAPERVVEHLTRVLEAEEVAFDTSALWLLGKAADGSMRDAMSLTDQAIAFGQGEIRREDVAAMLGTLDHAHLIALAEALAEVDAERLLAEVASLAEQGPDFAGILDEVAGLMHRLAIAQMVPGALDNGHGDREQLLALASRFTAEDVQLYYQIALQGRADMDSAPDTRTALEMSLLRMLAFRPQGVPTPPQTELPLRGQPQRAEPAAASSAPAASEPDSPAPVTAGVGTQGESTTQAPPWAAEDAMPSPEPAGAPTPEPAGAPATSRPSSAPPTLDTPPPDAPATAAVAGDDRPVDDVPPWQVDEAPAGPAAALRETLNGANEPAIDAPDRHAAEPASPPEAAPDTVAPPRERSQPELESVDVSRDNTTSAPAVAPDDALEPSMAAHREAAAARDAGEPGGDQDESDEAGREDTEDGYGDSASLEAAAAFESWSAQAASQDGMIDDDVSWQSERADEAGHSTAGPRVDAASDADASMDVSAPPVEAGQASAAVGGAARLTHEVWLAQFDALEIGGLTRNLAANCVVAEDDGQTLRLRLDPAQSAMLSETHESRIKQAIAALGYPRGLQIDVAPLDGAQETARLQRERKAREQHARAVEALRNDPHIQELEARFGARLLEETVSASGGDAGRAR
ncbi:DNA polymerase III subunit gamma/tau [Salinicola aestuarinus]|uniref:DNA polymerase III subunit gamma/tau n=1 Tax=Salinicola aestuarinus TaxID=1949082 RepID=UPI000DA182C5|nr:DNA polymerase III subunit gamma/tau [Salinicola aestuarinus]